MFNIVFYHPEIPGNTGNAIRLSAVTGSRIHLVEPLGFDLEEKKVRRAGLDYHDMAALTVHPDLQSVWDLLLPARVFALSTDGEAGYADVAYREGDVLLFGPESVGLPVQVKQSPEVTARLRIPMLPGARSLNLANSASIVLYEAWRQRGFGGAS